VLETRRDDKIKLLEIALQGLTPNGSSSKRPANTKTDLPSR